VGKDLGTTVHGPRRRRRRFLQEIFLERDADGREASTSDRSEASVERLAKQAREYQVSDPANLTSRGTERGITNRRLISTLVFIIL
jgi:hypothetical protein